MLNVRGTSTLGILLFILIYLGEWAACQELLRDYVKRRERYFRTNPRVEKLAANNKQEGLFHSTWAKNYFLKERTKGREAEKKKWKNELARGEILLSGEMKNEINLLRKIKKILDFNKIGQANERISEKSGVKK